MSPIVESMAAMARAPAGGRRARSWLLAPLLVGATQGLATPAEAPPAVAVKSVRADSFPEIPAHFRGGIEAFGHVEYANYAGYRPLLLDLYLHSDRARERPRPLVIWIHGGGWNRGDARQSGAFKDWPGVLAMVAARGYVVASVDYRLTGEAKFPAQIQDVKAAIRFLRSRADDFGIDPARVFLWGGSAGAHLAALTAVSCGVAAFDPPASTGRLPASQARLARPLRQSDCVEGAALWYGIFSLTPQAAPMGSAVSPEKVARLLGCDSSVCRDAAAAASPIKYVRRGVPPMLLIHGTADTEAAVGQSRMMAERMRAAGADVQFVPLAGVNHGFIGNSLEATRRASLEALNRTLRFFDALRLRGSAREH